MMQKLICFIFCCVMLLATSTFSQSAQDAADMKGLIYNAEQTEEHYKTLASPNFEEFVTNQLFSFYKRFISSQDGDVCTFHPSCSVYALHSVKENGFLLGTAGALDRLIRCNGLNNKKYDHDAGSGKLHDPVN